jgi:hypothetical protein
MRDKAKAERRLRELVKEGLASPIEPEDPAFWRKRREALRAAIIRTQKSKKAKLSS